MIFSRGMTWQNRVTRFSTLKDWKFKHFLRFSKNIEDFLKILRSNFWVSLTVWHDFPESVTTHIFLIILSVCPIRQIACIIKSILSHAKFCPVLWWQLIIFVLPSLHSLKKIPIFGFLKLNKFGELVSTCNKISIISLLSGMQKKWLQTEIHKIFSIQVWVVKFEGISTWLLCELACAKPTQFTVVYKTFSHTKSSNFCRLLAPEEFLYA